MGSPESEEPTTNQPEEIVIFPRSASHTPRVRLRPLSSASNWSRASEEGDSDPDSPTKITIPPPPINQPLTKPPIFKAAIEGRYLPAPADINEEADHSLQIDLSNPTSKSEVVEGFHLVNSNLKYEITREINDAAIGYGQYYLNEPKLSLRPQNDFVLKQNQLQTAALVVIQALDTGSANHPGETANTFLTPQSWFRLTCAVLAAIIRGNLRSPNNALNGVKPINTNNSFDIHKDLVHPLTEGAAVRHMALQIAEAYNKTHTNPFKLSPTEFYNSLLKTRLETITKAAEVEASTTLDTSNIHHHLHQKILEDPIQMTEINNTVKQIIFNELNKEALDNIDTWREIYREEFKEVMHQYIGVNKFGIDPCFIKPDRKGKCRAKSSTPDLQQSNKEIERIMRTDWLKLTPCIEITTYKTAEFTRLQAEANQQLQKDIEDLKNQFREEHEAQVYRHRDDIRDQIKLWKVNHANAQKFDFIKKEAKNLGYTLTSNVHRLETSRTRAATPPRLAINPYVHDPNVTPTPVHVKRIRTDDFNTTNTINDSFPPTIPPLKLPEDISLPPSSLPSPMEEDYPLDSLQQYLKANNGGTAASTHVPNRDTDAPPPQTTPIPVVDPEQPLASTPSTSDPLPASLAYSPSRLAAPIMSAPTPAAPDKQTPIRKDCVGDATPGPSTSDTNTSLPLPATNTPPPPPVNKSTRPKIDYPTTWAAVLTGKGMKQQDQNKSLASQSVSATNRLPSGKPKTTNPTNNAITEVTVVRGKGILDPEIEKAISNTPPSVIVNTARSEIEKTTSTPLILLSGRWTSNENNHNFVYQFAGKIPFESIFPYRKLLVEPLKSGELIPNEGWNFAQIRQVPTRDSDGTLYAPDTLLWEIRQNNIFHNIIITVPPFWHGLQKNILQKEVATIKFIYVDTANKMTNPLQEHGLFMFAKRCNVIVTGDDTPQTPWHVRHRGTPSSVTSAPAPIPPTHTCSIARWQTNIQK
ncbi:hypothetical protein EDB87DRAFT_1582406 [Lactarius vividus]|nr:hypothetical protein EDB87DRAFT_1582406 [Lactarius vividus]